MDTDQAAEIYNSELIKTAHQVEEPLRLKNPDVSAQAISVICGSEVAIDLNLSNNMVTAFGYEVEACALTKAAVAIIKQAIIGKTQQEIKDAGIAMENMLKHDGQAPIGDWAGLALLEPVKDYSARHNSILLPFVAVEKAFNKILA